MKNKILSIIRFDVEKSIRNKWFVILNILLLLVTVVSFNFGTVKSILEKKNIKLDKDTTIIVADPDNLIFDDLKEAFLEQTQGKNIILQKEEHIQEEYRNEDINKETIIVTAKYCPEEVIKAQIISKEGIDTNYYSIISKTISEAKNKIYATEQHIDEQTLNKLLKEPSIERIMLGVNNENSGQKQGIQLVFNYLILIILMIVLSKIANDISQEKISKSIEYVLTSISAKKYLISKVISINLAIIVQAIFYLVYLLIAMVLNTTLQMLFLGVEVNLQNITNLNVTTLIDSQMLSYVLLVFVYIVVTVLILSVIQAAISSRTTNIDEAGNATLLLVTINLIIYLLANLAITPLRSPSILIYIVSCIPIVSMYFIPTMLLLGQATIWQVIIATVLLFGCIPFIFKIATKIFKNGILDYQRKKVSHKKEKIELTLEQKQEQIIVKKEYSKYGFVIGFAILLFVIVQLLLGYLLMPLAMLIQNMWPNLLSSETLTTITNMIVFIASLLVPTLFVLSYLPKSSTKEKKINKEEQKTCLKAVLMALPLMVILQVGLGYLYEWLGLNYDVLEKFDMYTSTSIMGMILFFIQTAILPAIFEELFVRKAILGYSKKFGVTFAILVSALVFGLLHMNLAQGIFAFLTGIILGYVVVKTKRLFPAMIIHFLNNGYAALVTIFAGHTKVLLGINLVMLVLMLIGTVLLIIGIIRYHKGKKQKVTVQNMEKKIVYKKIRYIFTDYVAIIAIIVIILFSIYMQKLITLL